LTFDVGLIRPTQPTIFIAQICKTQALAGFTGRKSLKRRTNAKVFHADAMQAEP
jgi:hypothetical protein